MPESSSLKMPSDRDTIIAVAEQFLIEHLCLKTNEKLLIYVDSSITRMTVKALQEAAYRKGIYCTVGQLPSGAAHIEKEQALQNLIEREKFDVLCEASEAYFYPSMAWERARAKGAGIYAIGPLNDDAFVRCLGNLNRSAMEDFGNMISGILRQAGSIEITSRHGSRIFMQMKVGAIKRSWLKLTRRPTQSMVSVPTGCMKRGKYTFFPGQISFLGVPVSIHGIAVIDGYIWPPPELGPVTSNVVLHIANGNVIQINGRGREADALRSWLTGRSVALKHFCLGFNPGAELNGSLGEAERIFGAVTFGIGEYPFHVDAVMTSPTITIDGKLIEDEGTFVERGLQERQEQLMASNSRTVSINELS